MLDIRDREGKVVFSTPINEGCKRKYTLMQEDYISLVFSVEEPIYFRLGDSIYDGDFEVVDLIIPKYNEATAGYDYEARFDAYYWKWKNKKFFYAPEYGAREASWKLTANLSTHANIILRNLKHLGYTYKGKAFEFVIDSSVQDSSKFINYDNLNIIDALTRMAEEWRCEWWVTDNIIHFGRCEYGDPVDFILNENVEQMNRSDSKQIYATRIYAFGSQRNIPKNYRPVDSSITVNGIVQKRLMLPADTPYIDAFDKMRTEEAVEEIVIFDEVYPKRINKITEVESKESSVKNEETGLQEKIWTYLIKDKSFNFQEKYILRGEELRLTFQSGRLNGMDFAVSFKKGSFELVRNEDYGRLLPDDILKPNVGDEFILYGYDTSFVSDSLLPDAELELKKKALEYAEKKKIDPSTYECSMMSDYMENKGNIRTFEVGDRVRLINKAYFKDSRVSRIIGYEYPLDIPYDSPKYIVGETISYSHIGELKDEVKDLVYKERIYQGSQSNVYVVGQYDSTKPTDRNVLSSIRSLNTFLRKDKEDSTEHLITFLKGLKIGAKYSINEVGNAVLNNIESSVIDSIQAKFHELESTKLNSSEGTINTLTALTLFVKNLADVQKLDVKETATILNAVIKGTLSSPKFVSGFLGEGFRIAKSSNGDWNLEIDNLIVRKVFQVFELIIQEVKYQGGVVIHSPAGGKITKVTDGGSYWRCEIESADTFFKDDLVLCQQFTGKVKRYWRAVTSAGDGYINLSKTDCEANSAIPEVDDEIATLGNKTNTARQSAYLISVVGTDAPYTAYYSGINSYSLKGKEHTRIGNLEGVVSPAFGPLKGSGAHLVNAYIQGIVKLQNGKTVETVISETSSKLSSDIGKVKTELKEDISKSKEETKGEINSSVSSVRNELNTTISKAEEQFNTGINQTKTELSSNISSVKQELEGKINTDIQVSKESITKQITQSQQEAEAAAKAYTDAQDKAKLTQAQSYADGKVATEQKRAIEDVNAKLTAAKSYADAADAKLKTEQQAYADGKVTATEEKLLQTANDNLAAAKAYAEAQDKALKVKTDAYADGKITAEEKRAIADANAKLAAAKKYAEAQDNLLKTQQEAYADGKVTASEKRAIADATNKVNAAKSELNALVSKAQSTADDAKDAIDGLEIGGRNYLHGWKTGSWKEPKLYNISSYFLEFGSSYPLEVGEKYTFSVFVQVLDDNEIGSSNLGLGEKPLYFNIDYYYKVTQSRQVIDVDLKIYRYIYHINFDKPVWDNEKHYFAYRVRRFSKPTQISSNVWGAKLEKGNKATDWTPAPEDTEAQISKSKEEAEAAAKAYADAQDNLKQIESKAYADGRVTEEEKRAIADAKAKLEAAKKYADAQDALLKTQQEAYADGIVTEAEQRAINEAQNRVDKAKEELNALIEGVKESVTKEIKDVEQRFEIAEGQINSHIKETTQLVTEAKLTNGESIKTLEQVKVQINDINVTAGKINTTLGEVTKKQGEINSSISNLEQTAGSIKTSIEDFKETEAEIKSTANKIEATHEGIVLEASEKSAQKAIDRLEIGVRNWVLNSDRLLENNHYPTASYPLSSDFDVVDGDNVSIAIYGKLSEDRSYFGFWNTHGNQDDMFSLTHQDYNESKGRYEKVVKWRKMKGDNTKVIIYPVPNTSSKNIISKVFIVSGSKMPDWTPAPEDTEAQISKSKEDTEAAAKAYADAQDNLKQIESKAYADGKVTAEEKRAIADAKAKLDAAKAYADAQDAVLKAQQEAYADGKITAEEQRAIEDAKAKLEAAKKYAEAQDNLLKTQQEAYADGKVTASEKRAIADATNKVNAAKSELNALVSKAQSTADNAKSAVDDLEFGGRNLIIRSTETKGTLINISGDITSATGHDTSDYIGVSDTQSYFFTKKESGIVADAGFFRYAWYGEDKAYMGRVANSSNSFQWLPPSGVNYVRISYPSDSYPKFEKGNKPTDWSPAPEDIDAQFTETKASLKVLNDKLIAEVSKTNGLSKDLTAVKQDHNSFKVQVKTDISGAINSNNEVILSSFKMDGNKIGIGGKYIDLTGKVTFSALNSESQNKINTATKTANNAAQDIFDLKLEVGDLAYLNTVEKAQLGTTVIDGGFLRTDLLQAKSIKAEKLDIDSIFAQRIRTGNLDVLSGATIANWRIRGDSIETEQNDKDYFDPISHINFRQIARYSTSIDSVSGGITSSMVLKQAPNTTSITQLSPLGLYTQMALQNIKLSDFGYPLGSNISIAGSGITASIKTCMANTQVFGVSGYINPNSSISPNNFYGGFFQNLLVVGRTELRGGSINGFALKTIKLTSSTTIKPYDAHVVIFSASDNATLSIDCRYDKIENGYVIIVSSVWNDYNISILGGRIHDQSGSWGTTTGGSRKGCCMLVKVFDDSNGANWKSFRSMW